MLRLRINDVELESENLDEFLELLPIVFPNYFDVRVKRVVSFRIDSIVERPENAKSNPTDS